MDKHLEAHYVIHLPPDSLRSTICLELISETKNGILTHLWEGGLVAETLCGGVLFVPKGWSEVSCSL